MKTSLVIIALLVGFAGYAQHNHDNHSGHAKQEGSGTPTFKDKQLGEAYNHYIHLKNALVASKQDEASKASKDLVKALAAYKNDGKAHQEAVKVSAAQTLDAQRKAFTNLSNEMTDLVKNGKLDAGEIYLEYCPMANNNTGGYWLSNEKQVLNPYFGDKMLKCGSVKETIK